MDVFHRRGKGYTLVAVGGALLALSTFIPIGRAYLLLAGATMLAAAAVTYALRARRAGSEDVGKLIEAARRHRISDDGISEAADADDPGEDREDPYCAACDEVYPPGTRRCLQCFEWLA